MASSNSTFRRFRIAQNYLVIWFDKNFDIKDEDYENKLEYLRSIVNEVRFCTTSEQCIEFIKDLSDEKAFIILSTALSEEIVSKLHAMPQVDTIYIDFEDKKKLWSNKENKKWPKIQYNNDTSIKTIYDSLKKVAHECDHDKIPMSFVPKESKEDNLNELDPSFMYSILFKEIILEMNEDENKSIEALINYCRQYHISESELDKFKHEYHDKNPIWWYTSEMFLYGMLNRALRTLDMEAMIKMSFFIRNLHRQLEELHHEQSNSFRKGLVVYRGQALSESDFQHLLQTKGGLISFNNFLSTSEVKQVASRFLPVALRKYADTVGVLFIMTINPSSVSASKTPFARIGDYSTFKEENEILFAMHTVFRIGEIKGTSENERLWEVQLTLTSDNDPQRAALTKRLKEEIHGNGWYRIGQLMLKVGHFNQAEELYNELLNEASNDSVQAHIYNMLGILKNNQGEYKDAALLFEKSVTLHRKFLSNNDPALSNIYNNLGLVHKHMGEYTKALEFFGKAHAINEATLPPDHPDLALTYCNIGSLYNDMGEYQKALEYYEKDLEITKKSLPSNHPNLATSYSNIGRLYFDMGNSTKALEFYEKDLEITRKVLPSNHPDLAIAYGNIGKVHITLGNYSKALSFLEKTLSIQQESLPPTHPHIKITKNTIDLIKTKL